MVTSNHTPLQKHLKLMKYTFTWGPSVVTSSIKASIAIVLKSIHHRWDKRYSIDFLRYCIIAILKSLRVLKGCVNRFKFSKSFSCFALRSARQWQLTQSSNFRKNICFLLLNKSIPPPTPPTPKKKTKQNTRVKNIDCLLGFGHLVPYFLLFPNLPSEHLSCSD